MGIQALHILRIGLCQKVDNDVLTVQEETKIFEDIRQQALSNRRTQEKRAAERMKEKEL